MTATTIRDIHGREVLDSRGRPTVEVEVRLESDCWGRAIAPSGSSTGRHEAVEIRDGDPTRHAGRGVLDAVASVNGPIAKAIRGFDAADQAGADACLIALDGTDDRSVLGSNAMLPTSLAICRAAAEAEGVPLWRRIGDGALLPLPMVNVLSGGLHAERAVDCQDFLVLPVGAGSYSDGLLVVADVLRATSELLSELGHSTLKADEGGFGPTLPSNEAALDLLVTAIERAGYAPGAEVAVGVDLAATHFYDASTSTYRLAGQQKVLDGNAMIEWVERWLDAYPIVSLEDPLAEDDWEGWTALTARIGDRVQLVGDDLFATRVHRLERGIAGGAANAVLVKPNQVGTLTETLAVMDTARKAGFATVISARSGETEDAFIADLAVATRAGQIKIGSLAQSERLAKYNQLLRIEEALTGSGSYAGSSPLSRLR